MGLSEEDGFVQLFEGQGSIAAKIAVTLSRRDLNGLGAVFALGMAGDSAS